MLDLESIRARYETAETELWGASASTGDAFFKELAVFVEAVRADIPALVTEVERLQTAISSFGHLVKAPRALYCFASALEKEWSCKSLNHVLDRGWLPGSLRELAGDIQWFLADLRGEAE